jgi:D-alanyl-D-alanine carboxypeptidase/D-alanyl-D-alanine-endopeptidase (penicillin-binding protein 4)
MGTGRKRQIVVLLVLTLALCDSAALARGGRQGVPAPLPAAALAHAEATWRAAMRAAGPSSGAEIVDLDTGQTLFSVRDGVPRSPASVEKLYTLASALGRFGADSELQTRVVGVGGADINGVWHGNLYLVGGGDPTFGSAPFIASSYGQGATVSALGAELLSQLHLTRIDGSIIGDETEFDSRRGEPASGYALDPFLTGALSALAFNRGASGRLGSPAAYAASQLAAALRARGVKVARRSVSGKAPLDATVLALVPSPPMRTLARMTALGSDNFFAEMLLKDLGYSFGGAGTTPAGAHVVRDWLASTIGIRPQVVDGSGLSRADHTSPRQIVALLRALWPESDGPLAPIGAALRAALPVAGRSGTLRKRMRSGPAAGRCQAKTGSLIAVSSLAGWCDGRFAFALMLDGIDLAAARALQNRMTEALAALD